MEVTLSGMVTLLRLVHLKKAFHPMEVTLSPMVTLLRLVQSSKAQLPMEVTLSPMVTLVRLLQSSKACDPMEVTGFPSHEDGMIKSPLIDSAQPTTLTESSFILNFRSRAFWSSYSNRARFCVSLDGFNTCLISYNKSMLGRREGVARSESLH